MHQQMRRMQHEMMSGLPFMMGSDPFGDPFGMPVNRHVRSAAHTYKHHHASEISMKGRVTMQARQEHRGPQHSREPQIEEVEDDEHAAGGEQPIVEEPEGE
jgi:hypothetical protein